MSEHDYQLPLTPLMGPVKARDIARGFEALARHFDHLGFPEMAEPYYRRAQVWLAYSTNLAALPPGKID